MFAPLARAANPTFQDFGSVSVGSSSSATLTYQFTGISGQPVFSLQYQAGDYSLGTASCSGSTMVSCSVAVAFSPRYVGSRRNAVRVTTTNGTVLATSLLNGTGTGAQAVLSPGQISTFAGTSAYPASGDGGLATAASFADPEHFALDPAGNLFIVDAVSETVREINASTGIITRVAGNGFFGYSGDGGPASLAELNSPGAVAVDGAGNIYIADTGNNRIRRVDPVTGFISTIAGTGATSGSLGDGGPATSAELSQPSGLAVAPDGTLYVADTVNNRIRKIDTSGNISTVAGGGNGSGGTDAQGDGAAAANATLNGPMAIALDAAGNLYIADTGNQLIREVTAGIIFVVAGNGSPAYSGDGPATQESISGPTGVWVDAAGWIYVADTGNSLIRAVSPSGVMSTIAGVAGNFDYSGDGGPATAAHLYAPSDVVTAANGALYILDRGNRVVRMVSRGNASLTFPSTPDGSVSATQVVSVSNIGNEPLTISSFALPNGFVQQSSGMLDCIPPVSVAAGSACGIGIAFAPQQSSLSQGTISLASNSISASSIAVQGTGTTGNVTAPVSSVTALSFGSVAVGKSSVQTFSITGTTSITLLGLMPSGTNAPDFQISSPICTQTTCTISITFSPAAAGQRSATITAIDVESGTEFEQSISLSGSGTSTPPQFAQTTLNFGNQVIGSSSTLSATFTNPGGAAVSLGGAAFSSQTSDFALESTTCGVTLNANSSCTVTISFNPSTATTESATVSLSDMNGDTIQPLTITGTGIAQPAPQPPPTSSGLRFVPITPCRVVDTRGANGQFGGPYIPGLGSRSFPLPQSNCGIPADAAAYALNVTVIPHGPLGYITVWPTGVPQPVVSNLNAWDGRVKANATIVSAGTNGAVSIYATNDTDLILDVSGYFVPASANPSALVFYPLTPCRVVDTRGPAASLGGPTIAAAGTRNFPITMSSCNVPSGAQAYSLNFTVVPKGPLGYLSVWPTGQNQPGVSTLNSYNGTVVANAAIVPAGNGGDISVYASNETDVIIDINGYFGPAGSGGGLSLYNMAPCRVYDSRQPAGSPPYTGERTVAVTGGACAVPADARALVFNATALPSGDLGFLGLWPDGESQPEASTLNSWDGSVVSNLAIVPTLNGSVDTYLSDPSQLILDVFGYFAP